MLLMFQVSLCTEKDKLNQVQLSLGETSLALSYGMYQVFYVNACIHTNYVAQW